MNRKNLSAMAILALTLAAVAALAAVPGQQKIQTSIIQSAVIKAPPERIWKFIGQESMSADATGKITSKIWPFLSYTKVSGQGIGATSDFSIVWAGQTYTGTTLTLNEVPNSVTQTMFSGEAQFIATLTLLPVKDGTLVSYSWDVNLSPKNRMTEAEYLKEVERVAGEAFKVIRGNCEGK